jgi:hypothetical protein
MSSPLNKPTKIDYLLVAFLSLLTPEEVKVGIIFTASEPSRHLIFRKEQPAATVRCFCNCGVFLVVGVLINTLALYTSLLPRGIAVSERVKG